MIEEQLLLLLCFIPIVFIAGIENGFSKTSYNLFFIMIIQTYHYKNGNCYINLKFKKIISV